MDTRMCLKTEKQNKPTRKHCQKQRNGLERTVLVYWDGRFAFWVTAGPQDAPCRLNNSPGKPLSLARQAQALILLERLWQVPCPLAMCRLSSRWVLGPPPEATPMVIQLKELLLNAALWQSRTAWSQLSLVFAAAIYLQMIFTVLYFDGIGSSE